jgi:uncharacterized protein (TIGR02598 family)
MLLDGRDSRAAFSLAESLVAMAIVSFVLLSIIGVMPSGMGALNDSQRRAAESRICQTMVADYEGRTWANLATQPQVITYFDDQGVATSNPDDPRGPTKSAVFAVRATLIVNPEAGQIAMVSKGLLPGEGTASPFIRYVRIAITPNAADTDAVNQLQTALALGGNSRTSEKTIHVYTFLLANLEPEQPPSL